MKTSPRILGLLLTSLALDLGSTQADEIIRKEQADCVIMARELLRDPYFPLHAAQELGVKMPWPAQYLRAAPDATPRRQARTSLLQLTV